MNQDYRQVLAAIREEEVVGFLQELVRIPSVFNPDRPGENESQVAQFVARYLEKMGLEVHVEEVAPGRPNVIAFLHGRGPGPCLLLEAHSDVVTPGDPAEWSHDPFGGKVVGRRLYGRGACDTKNGIAAAIMAVKAIKEAGASFPGSIMLAVPVDEEGLMLGIKHFIQQGWADKVDAAIICEPEDNRLCLTQKGAMRVLVRIRGKMAHGAMPRSGANPNTRMAAFILAVADYERAEIARLGCHPYLGYPSLTPTVVRAPATGEGQLNVIPQDCLVAYDIRTVPGQDHKQILADLTAIARRLKESDPEECTIDLELIEERPVTETAKEEPVVQALARAYRLVTGREPVYDGVPGATDGTFLWAWKGIPIVTTGSGVREVPHQKDEWVDIDQLLETTRLYALGILEYLRTVRKG